jgi:serine phosphatase RsbU (regulator of sigma subunit)/anti-sigma regulatory factor (Ser/Thr protein kinase)
MVDRFILETLSLADDVGEVAAPARRPPPMDFFGQRLRAPADLMQLEDVRRSFCAFLLQAGACAEELSQWELVFAEAATNAVIHGSQRDPRREIEVAWSAGDGRVCLEVADSGPGLRPGQLLAGLPADPLQTSGRGLYLIQQYCDRVEHWQGPTGFRLIMWRAGAGITAPGGASEALLQSALAEISQCYESLAAFYRLGDALIAAARLPEFFQQAAGDIAKVVPHDRLSLHFQSGLQSELRDELGKLPCCAQVQPADHLVERVLQSGYETVWQQAAEITPNPVWGGFECGFCMPLRAGGLTLGALTLARRRQPYLVASELSTVRTYADLFGIALANANNALVREREQQALREIEIAATMQNDLLPLPTSAAFRGGRAVVRRRNARTVAGDYVDICPMPDGGILLAMVDVMGKGMSAALFAGMVRTALRMHCDIGQPVGQLLEDLNRVLCRQTGELTLFATCALVYISPRRDRALIVNAGHCPVLWLGPGVRRPSREIAPSGPPLGLYPDIHYTVEEQALAPGDQIVLVTDGLYEWESNADTAGAWQRLADMLRARRGEGGEAFWEAIQQRIRDANPHETDPRDDQTLLVWECRD